MELVTYFDPQPGSNELPDQVPSPFAQDPPHPLARRAAELLVDQLRRGEVGNDAELAAPGGGKMFGVLVVADRNGRIGYLRGFSGMLGGTWHVGGFVPPLFDTAARDAVWPAGEAELRELAARIDELAQGPHTLACRTFLAEVTARHHTALEEMRARHNEHRRERHDRRNALPATLVDDARRVALHELEQASRADAAEKKRLLAAHADERAGLATQLRMIDEERSALDRQRADRSRYFLQVLFDTYVIANARGERRVMREIFAPEATPGGAGDCAAPKLLGHAYQRGLRPLALAELWWGAPPLTGGRHAGVYYPACRGKCGPILTHMLDGLAVAAAPVFGGGRIAPDEPLVVFEDDWLLVVDKPVGLLSVPGRSGLLRDSVLSRLRQRYPAATGPLVVHRLDLDTSGLLLAAKDDDTHAAMQRLFARREIDKRYIAWLDGELAGDHGSVDLALRVDLDDRPRQVHDPVHGKAAHTEWQVLERSRGRTRVALLPRTGRTHQLRVHAAHPLGIGLPIVGDRLYGRNHAGDDAQDGARNDGRLMLHAEALGFLHPRTGRRIELLRPAPF